MEISRFFRSLELFEICNFQILNVFTIPFQEKKYGHAGGRTLDIRVISTTL